MNNKTLYQAALEIVTSPDAYHIPYRKQQIENMLDSFNEKDDPLLRLVSIYTLTNSYLANLSPICGMKRVQKEKIENLCMQAELPCLEPKQPFDTQFAVWADKIVAISYKETLAILCDTNSYLAEYWYLPKVKPFSVLDLFEGASRAKHELLEVVKWQLEIPQNRRIYPINTLKNKARNDLHRYAYAACEATTFFYYLCKSKMQTPKPIIKKVEAMNTNETYTEILNILQSPDSYHAAYPEAVEPFVQRLKKMNLEQFFFTVKNHMAAIKVAPFESLKDEIRQYVFELCSEYKLTEEQIDSNPKHYIYASGNQHDIAQLAIDFKAFEPYQIVYKMEFYGNEESLSQMLNEMHLYVRNNELTSVRLDGN